MNYKERLRQRSFDKQKRSDTLAKWIAEKAAIGLSILTILVIILKVVLP